MPKDLTKKRKQDLGIFYTPQEVVNFIFDILNIWKNKEDKETHRWQKRKPRAHYPSVIDPACGEGIFLKKAVDTGFTSPAYIWGVDLDEKVKERWKEITLLKSFGSKANLDFHFYHQDGLLPIPEKKVGHKKGGMNQYDAVVGNPPYGGMGIGKITQELEKSLFEYEIWKRAAQKQSKEITTQLGLMENSIKGKDKERLKKFPIEILFIDRFIQLAKPGGWIAIIIPDGILTNSNYHYVRKYLSQKTIIKTIISLPRLTFKDTGTNAKTSILFLRKLKNNEEPKQDYKIFLAKAEDANIENFDTIVKCYQKLYNQKGNNMNKSDFVQITNDQTGKEAVMVRVDKTLMQLMEEKPSSVWSTDYWHPKWEKLMEQMNSSQIKFSTLDKFFTNEEWLISTDHVRASRGEKEGDGYPIEYYTPANLLFTGYDVSKIPHCTENAFTRMSRATPLQFDLLLGGFGMGPTGKSVVLWQKPSKKAIVGNIFILRTRDKYSPFVLDVFLKTRFGKGQLDRVKIGVAMNKISNDRIKNVLVPLFSSSQTQFIETSYKKMSEYHDEAMKSKKNGEPGAYKTNIETAGKMLKDLITYTETVIQGKLKDVV